MAPKRATSGANVTAQRGKVSRNIDSLCTSEARIEFQNDLSWVMAQLKEHPEKMGKVKVVLKMNKVEAWDRALCLNPELMGKSILRLPPRFLAFEFFSASTAISKAEMTALLRADARAPLKMLMRLCVVPASCPIGSLVKAQFAQAWSSRMLLFKHELSMIRWGREFNIDWDSSGLYSLHPPLPEGGWPVTTLTRRSSSSACGRR